jgi:hypothetical protein
MKLVDREGTIEELTEIDVGQMTLDQMAEIVSEYVRFGLEAKTDDELILLGEEIGYEFDVEYSPEETAELDRQWEEAEKPITVVVEYAKEDGPSLN